MKQRIIEIMKDVLEEQNIDINSTQDSLENWNSLRHLNLVSELEDEFDIELEPDEIAEMKSVQKIVDIIKQKNN
ncbi:MAG: acyl carrier protein [Bacteroidaceae bacterium]|nr:acyl carrier protein [Bacteroidaceae bacterium]